MEISGMFLRLTETRIVSDKTNKPGRGDWKHICAIFVLLRGGRTGKILECSPNFNFSEHSISKILA